MNTFEYDITTHAASEFEQLAVFCSHHGECRLEEVAAPQMQTLQGVLNARGRQGWELVQVAFGKDGVVAFWKKALDFCAENQ